MRRGISPVIAVLLLIVIAVAAAVLTYIWVVGYMGSLQQQSGAEQLQEKIKIEAVSYSDNTLTIYVRNIGDVRVNITAAYLIGPQGTVIASNLGLGDGKGVVLAPGQVSSNGDITISVTGGLDPGTTYTVKVVTEKGTEATYTFTYRT